MARYVCVWKDNKGVEHATEQLARQADAKIEYEYKQEVRRQNLTFKFRSHINAGKLPYFRSYDCYSSEHAYRQSQQNCDAMINWIFENEEMIKSVLNG